MLTSGGCVIDHQLPLHQVDQHDVRKLGAGRVAMLWETLLEEILDDVAAVKETLSLTWYSSQQLNQGIQLPSSLQSLTFAFIFNQSLESIQLPSSLRSFTSRNVGVANQLLSDDVLVWLLLQGQLGRMLQLFWVGS